MRRIPLSESLVDLVAALADSPATIGVHEIAVDVPVEVAVVMVDGDAVFQAHPRRWRLVTDFDERPGRMQLRYRSTPAPPGGVR